MRGAQSSASTPILTSEVLLTQLFKCLEAINHLYQRYAMKRKILSFFNTYETIIKWSFPLSLEIGCSSVWSHIMETIFFGRNFMLSTQTGKYVMRTEDLPRTNNLSCTQWQNKHTKCEKYTCQACRYPQKGTIKYAWMPCEGGFSKCANLTGKISSAAESKLSSLVVHYNKHTASYI